MHNVLHIGAVGDFEHEFSILGLFARLPFKHLLSEVLNQKFNLKIKNIMLLTFTKPQFKDLIKQGIKQHTIREDKNNRWKVGNSIQFWMGNPRNVHAKNKPHQFGTGVCCKVVQISIYPKNDAIICDGYKLSMSEIENLAINDGFENWEDMKTFFTENFVGKMIFWKDCVWL